jgi:hypothetical protein
MGVGGQRHAPAALPPGKTRYPLYSRLSGTRGRSQRVRKISPPPGFDPRTVQPIPTELSRPTYTLSAKCKDLQLEQVVHVLSVTQGLQLASTAWVEILNIRVDGQGENIQILSKT